MASKLIVGGVVLVLVVLAFFLAPVVDYTFSSYNFGIGTAQVTAYVSPSFYLLGCGMVWNPTQSGSALNITVSHQLWSGGEWRCK